MITDKGVALSRQFSQRTSYNGDHVREGGSLQCSNSSLLCHVLSCYHICSEDSGCMLLLDKPKSACLSYLNGCQPTAERSDSGSCSFAVSSFHSLRKEGIIISFKGLPWQVWRRGIQSLFCRQIVQHIPALRAASLTPAWQSLGCSTYHFKACEEWL